MHNQAFSEQIILIRYGQSSGDAKNTPKVGCLEDPSTTKTPPKVGCLERSWKDPTRQATYDA